MGRISDEYVRPIATCDVGLGSNGATSETETWDHLARKSYHEGYVQYLHAYDHECDARPHQLFVEKSTLIREEIDRLEDQNAQYEERLQYFGAESERLLVLRNAPR